MAKIHVHHYVERIGFRSNSIVSKRRQRSQVRSTASLLYASMTFKFYCGTYCVRDEIREAFVKHAKRKPGKEISEYHMIMFLTDKDDSKTCYDQFKQESKSQFEPRIDYPVV